MKPRPQETIRSQIKNHAVELLISHGYRGLRFADIAQHLGVTRGNVHYHFGTKARLAEEVIVEYVAASLSELKSILRSPDTTFATKLDQLIEYCRKRYRRFNSDVMGRGGNPWSLVGRMRLEVDMLSPKSREVLGTFSAELKASTAIAVANAKQNGEFPENAPMDAMAGQLVAIIDCAPVITQYSGLFRELENLFYGYYRLIAQLDSGRQSTKWKPRMTANSGTDRER